MTLLMRGRTIKRSLIILGVADKRINMDRLPELGDEIILVTSVITINEYRINYSRVGGGVVPSILRGSG